MGLTSTDIRTLEDIVSTEGHCLNAKRCQLCPFRSMCLPEFLNSNPPTAVQRMKMAEDVLTHHYLVDEVIIEEHAWNKR